MNESPLLLNPMKSVDFDAPKLFGNFGRQIRGPHKIGPHTALFVNRGPVYRAHS